MTSDVHQLQVVQGEHLTVVCLVAALRGRTWAVVPGLVCAATALREVRALRRIDRTAGSGMGRIGRI